MSEVDILTLNGSKLCRKVEYVNIRGHYGMNITVRFWQKTGMTFHIDSSAEPCDFTARDGSRSDEDNFGYYITINSKFRCTESDKSTTQYWYGVNV